VTIPVPESATTVLQALAAACGAAVALLLFSLVVWAARDIAARSRDGVIRVAAVLLVLCVPVVGLVAYLLLRPRETLRERYERELIEEILARELAGVGGTRGPSEPPEPSPPAPARSTAP
jgi:hypothetical protein